MFKPHEPAAVADAAVMAGKTKRPHNIQQESGGTS
jgi:hypothetical protein